MLYFFPDSLVNHTKDIKSTNTNPRHSEVNIECLVFCTSLSQKEDVKCVSDILNSISEIHNWTIDLEDCDKVLRIEATRISFNQIIQTLHSKGFHCFELD